MASSLNETKHVHEQVIARPDNQFPPSLWGDHFLSYVENKQEHELYAIEVAKLKEIVQHTLLSKECTPTDKIILINNLERLGLAYHFEKEIEDELKQIFHLNKENGHFQDEELFIISLQFRLLRQHGFNISTGILQKFKDLESGGFKESLKNDIGGLLSLYESAYVRTHNDDILEEAVNFTTIHLKSFKEKHTCPSLLKEVEHALVQPLHRSMPRLEARHYISIYEQLESKNDTLLKLAKLNFNLLQMLYKQELCDLSRWWKKKGLITKLGYPRDRLVESYFISLATFYEPQYSVSRIMIAKVISTISIIDDTYDAYGTIPELQMFTNAVQKWNVDEIDHLPNYMKICYKALLDLFDDFEEELKEDDRSYAINTSKQAMKQLVQAYFTEAKWFIEGHSPPFSDYLSNGRITSIYCLVIPACYIGMKDAKDEVFTWLSQNPKIVWSCALIGRIVNDIASCKVEKQRGQNVTFPIECYMKEFGVPKEEAFMNFKEMVDDAWKEMNEECVKPTLVPWKILTPIFNLARIVDVLYKYDEDGYTHPEKVVKYHIASLLIDPVPI